MSHATATDGTQLYWEEAGSGAPIIFVHEFGGNYAAWEPQLRRFARSHRCITFAARGYPPSDVPDDPGAYSQAQAAADIAAVLDAAGVDKAHVAGLSMGGFAALQFGLDYPERARSLIVAGAGYGAEKQHAAFFADLSNQVADQFEAQGSEAFSRVYGMAAARIPFLEKDPRGHAAFLQRLAQHSARGAANTMRGVQARRPSLYDLEDRLRALPMPVLVMSGDEDDHCLQPALFLKRVIPASGVAIFPKSGHTLNLEEPELFNSLAADFWTRVEAGRWGPRDPRSKAAEIMKTG